VIGRFVFKIRLYLEDNKDITYSKIMYKQAKITFLSGKFPATLEEAIEFAALLVQMDYGDPKSDVNMSKELSKVIYKLLPPYLAKDKNRLAVYQVNDDILAHALTRITPMHYDLFGTSQDQVVTKYLSKLSVMCSDFFEGNIYKVRLVSSTEAVHKNFTAELYLVINSIGVHIFSATNFEKKRFILLSQLSGWNVSGMMRDQVSLQFGNIRTPSVYTFKTSMALEISKLIRDYTAVIYPDIERARISSRAFRTKK